MIYIIMGRKRGQTISIDTYIAIALFLVAIVFFYSYIGYNSVKTDLDEESRLTAHRVREGNIFGDGVFTASEEAALYNMNCRELKQYFGTSKDICIFMKDSNGGVVRLSNGTPNEYKYGVGCAGIEINNETCGAVIS